MEALELLASGRVKSKAEAAAMVGIDPAQLSPSQLEIAFASYPEFAQRESSSLLDVVHDGNGEPESVRQSLSRGVVAAAAVLGKCSASVGSLDKVQLASLKQARDWLALCREAGLWVSDRGPVLPGELQGNRQPAELDLCGVDMWLRDHGRRDGIGKKALDVLTERKTLSPAITQDQGEEGQA